MNTRYIRTLALVALVACAAPVLAQDYIVLDRRADEFDSWQDRVDSSYGNPVVSREFDVPVTVLEEQRTRTGLGYGGLMVANSLAGETGRSFDEIVAMKRSGMGWGRIAQENGVKLGPIVSRLDRADRAFRSHGNSKRDRMKSEKFVNGHDARDGRLDKPANIRGNGNGNGRGAGRGKPHAGGGKGKGKGGGSRGKGKK